MIKLNEAKEKKICNKKEVVAKKVIAH